MRARRRGGRRGQPTIWHSRALAPSWSTTRSSICSLSASTRTRGCEHGALHGVAVDDLLRASLRILALGPARSGPALVAARSFCRGLGGCLILRSAGAAGDRKSVG